MSRDKPSFLECTSDKTSWSIEKIRYSEAEQSSREAPVVSVSLMSYLSAPHTYMEVLRPTMDGRFGITN